MNSKIKILYVITQGAWGGAQRYIFDLVTNLTGTFEIYVAIGESPSNNDLQKKLEDWQSEHPESSITTIQLKHLHRSIKPVEDLRGIVELASLYHRLKPAIVHLNSTKAGIIGSFAKIGTFFQPTKYLYTVHGWVFNETLSPKIRSLYVWLERLTARCKDKIIVLSEADLASGEMVLGLSKNSFSRIPLGITPPNPTWGSTKAREVLAAYIGEASTTPKRWIGTIANFYNTKGLDILIEAIKRIREKLPPVMFILIGEGPGQAHIETLIKKYELTELIRLTGSLDNAAALMPAFDLFILPSRKEGLPYVLLEAIITNVPIIATAVGGIPALIEDKKTGLLVQTPEAGLLAEKILFALANPEVMREYATTSRKQNEHSLDAMLASTKAIYQSYQE